MATGLQTRHGNILQEAFKNGLQSFVNTTTNTLAATSTAGTPAAGTFYSTVVGRASMVDISQDLKASFGIERVMTQQIVQLQNEFGPNGEPVWSVVNDDRGLIRFVGASWVQISNSYGFYAGSNTANEYAEITFYGTGLNILGGLDIGRDLRASVDGGVETSSTIFPISTGGQALAARNYTPNMVYQVVSGLALGVHTAKIRINAATNNSLSVCGFEILNTNSATSLNVNSGIAYADGLKIVSSAAQSISYNSSFETGSLGTRGGHVVTYLKQDGTVGKAVTPVNAASAFLTSADHTNEEVLRTYDFREFGAGRTDDFSLALSNVSAAFTLDDGTTTLTGTGMVTSAGSSVGTQEYLSINNTGSFMTFTFVGTGLDIYLVGFTSGSGDSISVQIDGAASVGNIVSTLNKNTIVKLASGLPYGTHTVKLIRLTSVGFWAMRRFTVYQPKKPTVPSGAVELADYNVMANFAVNAAGTLAASQGVVRKCSTREFTYSGTWAVAGFDSAFAGGFNINSATAGNYLEYSFFGTGIEYKGYLQATGTNYTFAIDGSTNLSAYTTALYSANAGTVTFTPSTGTLSGTAAAAASYGTTLSITGLPLGLHKIRVTLNNTTQLYSDTLDIICPIYSAKSNVNADFQNTLPVGSNSLSDNRQVSVIKATDKPRKNWVQAVGVSSNPSTTSSSLVPCPDMSVVMNTTGGRVLINYSITLFENTAGNFGVLQIYIDGMPVGINKIFEAQNTGNGYSTVSDSWIAQLSPGAHKIDVYWAAGSGTAIGWTTSRTMNAAEF